MKRNSSIIIVLFLFLFSILSLPTLYSQQNSEITAANFDIDAYLNEIDQIYNEYKINNSDKDIDQDIENLKSEKENLESEIAKNKSRLEQNNASYTVIMENNKKIQNDIDDLYSQIALETNTSDSLTKRIKDIDNDLSNERAEIDNSGYESLSNEIEAENNRIRETGEQIKRRREEANKLKSKLIQFDEQLESYQIRDGLLGIVREKYTSHYRAEIIEKPNKSPKLVVLTQKLDVSADETMTDVGIIWDSQNSVNKVFKDCLIQYYIPLDSLKPRDISYSFKENCLYIYSPRPILDDEMLYIQTDPDKIVEDSTKGWFNSGKIEELKRKISKNIKQKVLQAGKEKDYLYSEAESGARFHLENLFRCFLKGIKGSNDVKIKIIFD